VELKYGLRRRYGGRRGCWAGRGAGSHGQLSH
jgi:hypothetical protein